MARGSEAKEKIVEKIKDFFGKDFIGEFDKKIYLWSTENGEDIQIALSLTCPKNPIPTEDRVSLDNSNEEKSEAITFDSKSEMISQEEKDNIAKLMEKLDL